MNQHTGSLHTITRGSVYCGGTGFIMGTLLAWINNKPIFINGAIVGAKMGGCATIFLGIREIFLVNTKEMPHVCSGISGFLTGLLIYARNPQKASKACILGAGLGILGEVLLVKGHELYESMRLTYIESLHNKTTTTTAATTTEKKYDEKTQKHWEWPKWMPFRELSPDEVEKRLQEKELEKRYHEQRRKEYEQNLPHLLNKSKNVKNN